VRRLAAVNPWKDAQAARSGCPTAAFEKSGPGTRAGGKLSAAKLRAHSVERYFDLKGKRQLDFVLRRDAISAGLCSDPFVYGRKWVGLEPVRMALRLKELWILRSTT